MSNIKIKLVKQWMSNIIVFKLFSIDLYSFVIVIRVLGFIKIIAQILIGQTFHII